ncbi:MAG TPA: cytochrome P450 [Pseudonocardiaceae bacterium]|nr:cytochrome P450 [Pseudonocardiaceae bacterium]
MLPVRRSCPFDAQPEYERLRAEGPIRKVATVEGAPVWVTTRHADARAVLADPRFSSDRRHPDFPLILGGAGARERARRQLPSMITMDGAEHSAARRAVIGEFTVKRLAALRPRIQQIVDGFIDALLATPAQQRPVDLVKALSLPVPSLVICELLGVPYADHDFFQERSGRLLRRSTPVAERQEGIDELRDYLDRLLTVKETEPGDDLLSRQIDRQRAEGEIDHESLIGLAFLLLIAGHETTANMISLSVVGLLDNPDQLAAIKADPATIPMAVEEFLRFFSIVDSIPRLATEDVELDGVTVRAGEGIVASGVAANWDPGTFDDAARLDVARGTRSHVAFGYGPHQCLGQNLARQELEVVFETLFRRMPDLKLAASREELSFKEDGVIYGVYELPVTW